MDYFEKLKEKAKAYDEALEYAHYLINERCKEGTDGSFHRADLQKMFPELKESEGEKIRKDCIKYLDWEYQHCPFNEDKMKIEKCVAWLEKQGEQKPVIKMKTPEESLGISSNEYKKIVDECIYGDDKPTLGKPELKEREQKPADVRTTGYWNVEDAMKEVEEKAEAFTNAHQGENADEILAQMRGEKNSTWSEEDEKNLNTTLAFIETVEDLNNAKDGFLDIKLWLKSLRPQSKWKPSKEQMEALLSEVNGWTKGCPKQKVLESLLMKLYGTDRKKENC